MVDCHSRDWARNLVGNLGLPSHLLQPITPPGSVLGVIRPQIADETNLPADLKVIAPGAHDTASAVAAVPAAGEFPSACDGRWCYVSSGTWSLLGAELAQPRVTPAAQAAMFTNELGVCGTIRFLKNIPGLWLVQECRRDLARQGRELDYAGLTRLANEAEPFRTVVDPADEAFQMPGDMLAKIAAFANRTGQPAPDGPGGY